MTVNFSRIDIAKLTFDIDITANINTNTSNDENTVKIFAINFNTIKFTNNKLGLRFSK